MSWLKFGEGDEQWSAPDPRDTPTASMGSTYAYLVLTCTSTKLACEKLAKIRAAVRKPPPSTPDREEP